VTENGVSGDRQTESGSATTDGPCATVNSLHGEEALKDA
jgi:hypothetical protein